MHCIRQPIQAHTWNIAIILRMTLYWSRPLKLNGITAVASSVTRKWPSKSMLNAYRVSRASEKTRSKYELNAITNTNTNHAFYSLIDWILYTLIFVARLMLQSRWFRSTVIKFKMSVRMVFFASPIICFSVALHGGPATSIWNMSKPSEILVPLMSTRTIPELVEDFIIFAVWACDSMQSNSIEENVLS